MLMLTIDNALNRIFRVQRRRPLAQKIIMYWSVLTLGPVLIGASLSHHFTLRLHRQLRSISRCCSASCLSRSPAAALTLLYVLVPYRHVEIAPCRCSAACSPASAFEVAKRALRPVPRRFPTYT